MRRNMSRSAQRLPLRAAVLSLLWFILSGGLLLNANVRPVDEMPIYDVVAVGVGRDEIVLATLAVPSGGWQWRFRTIPLSPNTSPIRSVELSRSGTKALVVFKDGTERVLDLTEKIDRLDLHTMQAPEHRLPNQFFTVTRDNQTCLADDAVQVLRASCLDATAAAVHEDGRTLYLLRDGTLSLLDRKGTDAGPLPFKLPASEKSQVLAGRKGDPVNFLVLTQQGGKVSIVDPTRADGIVGTYDTWDAAWLEALLAFSSRKTDASPHA